MQGRERVRTLYQIRRPQPHTTNPWKKEKEKIVGDKKKELIRPTGSIGSALKPASPTASNTEQPRSSQRDTERGTRVLRFYRKEAQTSAYEQQNHHE